MKSKSITRNEKQKFWLQYTICNFAIKEAMQQAHSYIQTENMRSENHIQVTSNVTNDNEIKENKISRNHEDKTVHHLSVK